MDSKIIIEMEDREMKEFMLKVMAKFVEVKAEIGLVNDRLFDLKERIDKLK